MRQRLEAVRKVVREAAPEAGEGIGYQMPTFRLGGNLIYFAAFKHHFGVYPTPDGIKAYEEDLSVYKNAKCPVQFPYSQPLPLGLIRWIVLYRKDVLRVKKR